MAGRRDHGIYLYYSSSLEDEPYLRTFQFVLTHGEIPKDSVFVGLDDGPIPRFLFMEKANG